MGVAALDLPGDRVDVGDGGEIEAAPPDERLEFGEERLGQGDVPGRRPGLDEGGPLPVLADALIVFDGRRNRDGGGGGGRVWPEAQIDAKDISVGGAAAQKIGDPLGEARGEGARLDARRQRQRPRLVEDRDIDIAGEVQFEGPELAHRQAEQAWQRPLRALAQAGDLAGAERLARRHGRRRAKSRIGEPRQEPRHRLEIEYPSQIGERDQQVQPRLQPAKAVFD